MTERIDGIPVDDGMFGTVDELEYHADRGSLSQSGAKILVGKGGPAKFRERMDNPPPPKSDFDFGHLAHGLRLGKGAQLFVLDPAVHGLLKNGEPSKNPTATDMWKQADAAARKRGELPVHIKDYRLAQRMVAEVDAHPIAGPLFKDGHAEVSMYATDPGTGIRLRGRADWITITDLGDGHGERPVIVDYKTALDGGADRDAFCKKAVDYGYHIQFAWYIWLYSMVKMCDPPAFLFVVQEKVAPFLVNVIELDFDALRLGQSKMREALRIYRDCTESGIWPGYPEIIHTGSLPSWAFTSTEPTMRDLLLTD